jgi:hypothetical protein
MHFKDIEVSTHASANEMRNCNIPAIRKFLMNGLLNHCGKSKRVQVVLITIPLLSLAPQERSMREAARELKVTPLGWSNRALATRANPCYLELAGSSNVLVNFSTIEMGGAGPGNLSHNTK